MARTNAKNGKGLNSAFVGSVKKPGRYGDGNNLYLNVAAAPPADDSSLRVNKSWVFRFMRDGRAREMGLGKFPFIGLADARQLAIEAGKLLAKGLDPIEVRDAERTARREEEAKRVIFQACAERFIAANEAAWKSAKHREQWRNTIRDYADPVLARLPVAMIDTPHVMKVLEPIWTKVPVTAERLRGRLEAILDHAKVSGWRCGENPARWRGHLEHLLPKRDRKKGFGEEGAGKVEHLAAIAWVDLPTFMAELRQQKGVDAEALEFTILTMARSGETLGAQPEELDLARAVWTVPASRTKTSKEHRKPLSSRALEIARKRIEAGGGFLFADKPGKPLSEKAMRSVLQRMGRGDLTVHGFRSSARDWIADSTNYPREVAEMALGHDVGTDVEKAYRRTDMFEKRIRLAQAWADFCSSTPEDAAAETGTVTPLRRTS
jgi:integrase